jgi:hypothetical protein
MSKRLHKSRQSRPRNRKFPVYAYLLIGGGLLLILGLILGTGASGDKGTPALTVDQSQIDFGTVKLGTPLTFEVKVTNTGDGMLRFKEKPYIEVLEGC